MSLEVTAGFLSVSSHAEASSSTSLCGGVASPTTDANCCHVRLPHTRAAAVARVPAGYSRERVSKRDL